MMTRNATRSASRTYLPMTEERKAQFLEAFKVNHCNMSAACRAVAPHSDNMRPARSTWISLRENDPDFRAALEEIEREFDDALEEEIRRRAFDGVSEPIFQKGGRAMDVVTDEAGEIVYNEDGSPRLKPASITRLNDRLLMLIARARLPKKYGEKHLHEHTGEIKHRLPTSIELLNKTPEERATIRAALEILGREEPTAEAIEYQPAIEAEFEVIEEDSIEKYERMHAHATSSND